MFDIRLGLSDQRIVFRPDTILGSVQGATTLQTVLNEIIHIDSVDAENAGDGRLFLGLSHILGQNVDIRFDLED